MTILRLACCAVVALAAAAAFAAPSAAQDGYRTPPEAITTILDSPPGGPAVSIGGRLAFLFTARAQNPNPNPMSRVLQRWWAIGNHIVRLAEAMPEEKYPFKPFADAPSFAGEVGHVADAHYSYCSRARGESNPVTVPIEGSILAKPELVAKLKESVAYCDTAYNSATDASLSARWQQGSSRGIKLGMLVGNIAHDNEHSSTMTMLMRMSGVPPPALDSKD